MKPIVVWGATGQALVINEFAAAIGYSIECLVDSDESVSSPVEGIPIVHSLPELVRWLQARDDGDRFGAIVAIGGERGRSRLRLGAELKNIGIDLVSAVHPAAYIATDAAVGEGFQAMAGAVVGARSRIGQQCIINTAASVDHECIVHDGAHIGPGSHVAGCVTIGECSFLGTGSVVLPRVRIGSNVIVGAGSVVTKNVDDGLTVAGNPARTR